MVMPPIIPLTLPSSYSRLTSPSGPAVLASAYTDLIAAQSTSCCVDTLSRTLRDYAATNAIFGGGRKPGK